MGVSIDNVTTRTMPDPTKTGLDRVTSNAHDRLRESGDATATLETIKLSSAASLKALAAQTASIPDTRQEIIGQLRQALAKGQYNLNPRQIADSMIDDNQPLHS